MSHYLSCSCQITLCYKSINWNAVNPECWSNLSPHPELRFSTYFCTSNKYFLCNSNVITHVHKVLTCNTCTTYSLKIDIVGNCHNAQWIIKEPNAFHMNVNKIYQPYTSFRRKINDLPKKIEILCTTFHR